MRRRFAGLVVAGGLVLVTGLPATAAPGDVHVDIAGYRYQPPALTVPAGTTITWTNEDTAPHTVTGTSGPEPLASPELGKGDSWAYTFAVAGTFTYYCTVHPDMTATLTVSPAPATTVAAGAPAATATTVTTRLATVVAAPATAVVTTTKPDLRSLERVAVAVLLMIGLGLLLVRRRPPEPPA